MLFRFPKVPSDKVKVVNYRQVCLQSSRPKFFDKLIYPALSFAIENNKQHGFTPGRSKVRNLLVFI